MSYDLLEFLKDCADNGIKPSDPIYDAMWSGDLEEIRRLRSRIIQIRALKKKGSSQRVKAFRGRQSRHLGLMLERLMLRLLSGCNFLDVESNVRSTTSEIDYLVALGPLAVVMPMFRDAKSHVLGEAKCVSGGFRTEWVTEMAGLLMTHAANLGIIFTAAPSRKISVGCRTVMAVQGANGYRVVPFGFAQLEKIIQGESFPKVLEAQFVLAMASSTQLEI